MSFGRGGVPASSGTHAARLCAALTHVGLRDAEAQEVAQDAFVRAWRGLGDFKGRELLYMAVSHRLQRGAAPVRPRAGARFDLSSEALRVEQLEDDQPGPEARVETDELRRALHRALLALPATLRAPVVLRDAEGLSIRQAAAILGLREGEFKNRLHRAGRLCAAFSSATQPRG